MFPLANSRVLIKHSLLNPVLKVDAISGRVNQNEKRLETASTLFNAFDPSEPIGNLSGNLPHWRQDGATYFVTFRTTDSLPKQKIQQWLAECAEWLNQNPEPHSEAQRQEYWERFPARSNIGLIKVTGRVNWPIPNRATSSNLRWDTSPVIVMNSVIRSSCPIMCM